MVVLVVRKSRVCCRPGLADDQGHRLDSSKLMQILKLAEPILNSQEEDLAIEIECEGELVSHYPVVRWEVTESALLFYLGSKHTDCLAKEKCKINLSRVPVTDACCGTGYC